MGNVIRAQPAGTPVTVTVEPRRAAADPAPRRWPWSAAARASYLGIAPVVAFQPGRPARAASPTPAAQFGQIMAGVGQGAWRACPKAIPDLFAKNRASTAGGQVTSVVGAADVHRAGGRGQRSAGSRRSAVVLLIIVVAEHLRRRSSTCCRCCRWTAVTSPS